MLSLVNTAAASGMTSKKMTIVNRIRAIAAVAFVTTLTALTSAQPPDRPPTERRAPDRDAPDRGPDDRPTHKRGDKPPTPEQIEKRVAKLRARVLRKKVGLDEAQAKKVETIFKSFETKRRAAQKELQAGRRDLRKLLKADSDDDQAYEKALARVQTGHLGVQRIRTEQFEALKKVLAPKQQAKLLQELVRMRRKVQRKTRGRGGRDKPNRGRRGRGRGAR